MPKLAIACPLGKCYLRHQSGIDPMDPFFFWLILGERAFLSLCLFELRRKLPEQSEIIPCSDFPGIIESFIFVISDEQRSESFSRSLRVRKSTDHKLLFVAASEL